MADFSIRHFEEHLNKIKKIQSTWRGVITRKKLRETLEEYRTIQVELGDTNDTFLKLKEKIWTPRNLYTGKQKSNTCSVISQNVETFSDFQESDNSLLPVKEDLGGKHYFSGNGSQETKSSDHRTLSPEHHRQSCGILNMDDTPCAENDSDKWTRDHVYVKTEEQSNISSELDQQTKYYQPKDSGDVESRNVSHLEAKIDNPEKGNLHFSKEIITSDKNKQELENERSSTAMELLWVQQAIESRKQYLRLRTDISE